MAFAARLRDEPPLLRLLHGAQHGAITVDEVLRDAVNPNIADPSTRRDVIVIPHPGQSNHNGGQLQFGPDGMLYMGTGDGGGGGDPFRTGQNLSDRRGKILRIDPRENEAQDLPYTIPANNPFTNRDAAYGEIWSYGVRNPWRFSFDRLTGAFVLGDVGQNAWEEIDWRPIDVGWGRGVNFGWSCMEGRHLYSNNCPEPENHTPPIFEYSHGAALLDHRRLRRPRPEHRQHGRPLPLRRLCAGAIRSNIPAIPDAMDDRPEDANVSFPTSFGEDACGHLYVMGQGSGNNVFRINSTDPPQGTCPDAFPLPTLTASV